MPNPMLDGQIYGPVRTQPQPKTYAPTYDPYNLYGGGTYGGTKPTGYVPKTPDTVSQAEMAQQQAAALLQQQQAMAQAEFQQQQAQAAIAEQNRLAYEQQMAEAQRAWQEQQAKARADMLGETLKNNVSWNAEDITNPQVGLQQYWQPTPIDSNYFRTQPGGYGFWENNPPLPTAGRSKYAPTWDPYGLYSYGPETRFTDAERIANLRKARGSSMAEGLQDIYNVMNMDPSKFSYAIKDQPQGGGPSGEGEGEEEGLPKYSYPRYGNDYPETWYEKMTQWSLPQS